jgi:hypothetical protein
MAMTYQELFDAIESYTEVVGQTDFQENIPNFVRNTELLVNNTVQLPAFRRNVTGEATELFQYVNAPSDFLSVFSLAVIDASGNYTYLLQKDVNFIREAYPYPTAIGTPKYYSLFSSTSFLLGPTPDDNYGMELHYYAAPESIVDAGFSWLGQNFPNVLLWGSLIEAYMYLKGEQDLIQNCQQKFEEAMMLLKQLGDGKDRQDNFRTTQVRDQVV